MRIYSGAAVLAVVLVAFGSESTGSGPAFAEAAKRPSRGSSSGGSRRSSRGGASGGGRSRGPPPQSKPRRRAIEADDYYDDAADEDDLPFGFPDDDVSDDDGYDGDEYENESRLPARRPSGRRGPPMPPQSRRASGGSRGRGRGRGQGGRGSGPPSRKPPSPGRRGSFYDDEYDDFEDDYRPRGRRGQVVPYPSRQQPGAFTRGLSAIRESIPDAATVKSAAATSISAARETTTKLSSNIYREVKGLTSSELEQVMLKATRPDDGPVKGKHVERLVGVTYQISGRYDIYDAVLRKLWNKMAEKDWRTSLKSLYILHRFSADGAPEHQAALKARLRELRRTRDPKRKGEKYFNSKTLLADSGKEEAKPYRDFMSRYAHYVLLRAQCFGGMFSEIAQDSSPSSSSSSRPSRSSSKAQPQKPITAAALRPEHLEAAQMILKAGCACTLKEDEVCESTAMCVERVVSDLIGLTRATAVALNRALKGGRDGKGADPAVVKRWCEFYSEELLPQTKGLMKETSPELDAYGLFLPSRMGASVSGELLQKGLQGVEDDEEEKTNDAKGEKADTTADPEESPDDDAEEDEEGNHDDAAEEEDGKVDEYDEYEYDEEEYYDDDEDA